MSAACPICGRKVAARSENASFPFCSPRCKSIDLGKWLSGDYRIATEERPAGAGQNDAADHPSNATLAAGNRKELPS